MTRAVVIAYPQALSFSGQTAATVLALRELRARGWDCKSVEFTALDRSKPALTRNFVFVAGVILAWLRMIRAATQGAPVIVFNHGQSLASFLRMGPLHLGLRALLPRRAIVTSLHGSVFLGWAPDSRNMRIFLRLLRASDRITVLGETQRAGLIALGIAAEQLVLMPNTADLALADPKGIQSRHQALADDPLAPIVILHLSLLIESKGYPAFLDACLALATAPDRPARPLEIKLVGPMAFTGYCTRFTTPEAKSDWINARIAALNSLPDVTAKWIPGAEGTQKQTLFDDAHIFVFPSRFPVEAQPLVLLEAMASGCAIVASDQGEIAATVGNDTGYCLSDVGVPALVTALRSLIVDHDLRLHAASAGRARAETVFGSTAYGKNWDRMLTGLQTKGAVA